MSQVWNEAGSEDSVVTDGHTSAGWRRVRAHRARRPSMTPTRAGECVVLVAVAVVGGCVTVPKDAGFGDVQAVVTLRTGQRIQWNQGTAADRAVAAAVHAMLREDLTADAAVQVALLNNQRLQATY